MVENKFSDFESWQDVYTLKKSKRKRLLEKSSLRLGDGLVPRSFRLGSWISQTWMLGKYNSHTWWLTWQGIEFGVHISDLELDPKILVFITESLGPLPITFGYVYIFGGFRQGW